MAAVERLSPDLGWAEVSAMVRPVFPRRRPQPPGAERGVLVERGPGLRVGLGIDIGPAFLHVTPSLLDSWQISFDECWQVGLDNLRQRVDARRYEVLEYEEIGGVPVWWFQSGEGWASTLLLLEDELHKRYGDEPRLLFAPMRDLLLAAPFDADREIIAFLQDEISQEDPNGLDLPILALVEGSLEIDVGLDEPEAAMVH